MTTFRLPLYVIPVVFALWGAGCSDSQGPAPVVVDRFAEVVDHVDGAVLRAGAVLHNASASRATLLPRVCQPYVTLELYPEAVVGQDGGHGTAHPTEPRFREPAFTGGPCNSLLILGPQPIPYIHLQAGERVEWDSTLSLIRILDRGVPEGRYRVEVILGYGPGEWLDVDRFAGVVTLER